MFASRGRSFTVESESRGFTLVELLVVVAIIVILIAILIPSLQKAMDVAQAAKCGTNLHGLGRANYMYGEDHSRLFPGANFGMRRPTDHALTGESWHTDTAGETGIKPVAGNASYPGADLWPYASTEAMYICPTYPGLFSQPRVANHLATRSAPERGPGLSYTMNASIHGAFFELSLTRQGGPWDETDGATPETTKTYSPADTLIYCEEVFTPSPRFAANGSGRDDVLMLGHRSKDETQIANAIGDLHLPGSGPEGLGKSNVLFGDGHVSLHTPKETRYLTYPGMLK